MSDELARVLLYTRGFLYLAIAVMLIVMSVASHFQMYRWHLRVFAVFFLILAAGGMSSLLKTPQVGQAIINYGATGWAVVMLAVLSRWIIFRK